MILPTYPILKGCPDKLLNWRNFTIYLKLFEKDTSPFVMDDFKTRKAMEQYTHFTLESNRFLVKEVVAIGLFI